jgi:hypothetical protein
VEREELVAQEAGAVVTEHFALPAAVAEKEEASFSIVNRSLMIEGQ